MSVCMCVVALCVYVVCSWNERVCQYVNVCRSVQYDSVCAFVWSVCI